MFPLRIATSHHDVSLFNLSVTANADYSKETSYKNTESEKTIIVSSRYLFPQGYVNFSPPGTGYADDVQLSPLFTQSINNALAKPTKLEQREAVDAVLKDFGEVFRTKVQVGGTLSAHTMETFKRSVSYVSLNKAAQSSTHHDVHSYRKARRL